MKWIYRKLVIWYWNNNLKLPKFLIMRMMRNLGQDAIRKLPIGFASSLADGMAYWPKTIKITCKNFKVYKDGI